MEFKAHRPSEYTKEKHDSIVNSISKNCPYEVAAWGARICEGTLYNWLNKGKADLAAGINSEFVQLLKDITQAEHNKIQEHLEKIELNPTASKGRMWILERRWRKYFGQDAAFYQELLEKATRLDETLKKLTDNNLQGAQIHGREMDSKGD